MTTTPSPAEPTVEPPIIEPDSPDLPDTEPDGLPETSPDPAPA